MLWLPLGARAQTPAGTPIDNLGTATYDLGASIGLTQSSNLVTIVVSSLRTPATVEFFRYAPGAGGAVALSVAPSECSSTGLDTGPFNPVPPPATVGGAPIALPGPLDLLPASQYTLGAPLFLRLVDGDANRDAAAIDSVLVRVTGPSGDSELVRLFETAIGSGIFTGHLQSSGGVVAPNDCALQTPENETLTASYVDAFDPTDTSTDTAAISPFSVVFDSQTGLLLDGIQITLIDDTSGLPAAVFGDDGTSPFPATITTGGTFSDGTKTYVFPPGSYRFPYVPVGTYRLDVTPPASYLAPSAVADGVLQTLPGAPFALSAASRGTAFAVAAAGALDVDVPLDPATNELFITKTANRTTVGRGEFVQYSVRVRNPGAVDAPLGMEVVDLMPLGFRYQNGSASVDGVAVPDPIIAPDGRQLTFALPVTPLPAFQEIRYVAEVTTNAALGANRNFATASVVGGTTSFTAVAEVLVREDMFSNTSIIVGRIGIGTCDEDEMPEKGLEGVRIYLENGTYTVTDERGFYHFEGVDTGTHVVQVDLDTVPTRFEPVTCQQNTRLAGRTFSQFADLKGGMLWRADFRVQTRAPKRGYLNAKLTSLLLESRITHHLQLRGSGVAVERLRTTTVLPPGTRYVPGTSSLDGERVPDPVAQGPALIHELPAGDGRWTRNLEFDVRVDSGAAPVVTKSFAVFDTPADRALRTPVLETEVTGEGLALSGLEIVETVGLVPGDDAGAEVPAAVAEPAAYDQPWLELQPPELVLLEPAPEFAPATAGLTIKLTYDLAQRLVVTLNGAEVSAIHMDEYMVNAAKTVAFTTWAGLDLVEGANTLRIETQATDGKVMQQVERQIHFAGAPVAAELALEHSQIVANGREPIEIALRMVDRWGEPARQGMVGEFAVREPYRPLDERGLSESRQLLGADDSKPSFEIGEGGIAKIRLHPTPQTGRVEVAVNLAGGTEEKFEVWLEPEERDWVLVGIAEGTVGYNNLSGNMESLDGLSIEENFDESRRLALFAKGRIRGEWLLTLAYDSRKKDDAPGESVKEIIDPDEYYTLYGDTTQQDYEAPSRKKLYLKLERHKYFALFGDYDTGLQVAELSRYNRSLTGLKTEYDGDLLSFSGFASEASDSFIRDEVRGDGTSGLYRLSRNDLVQNSETITIETRDRFKTEVVLSSQPMVRHVDYNIDYADGTLFFKSPIPSKDSNLDPIFIVAEYESDDDGDEALVAGGRGALKLLDDRFELGTTAIHEGNRGKRGRLLGTDLRLDFSAETQLRAELASTNREDAGTDRSGEAFLVELTRSGERLDGRAYLREQEAGFGLGQQAQTEEGTRKYGLEAAYGLTDALQLSGEAYRQTTLETDADRDVGEARADYSFDPFTLFGGLRLARDRRSDGEDARSTQVLGGGSYKLLDDKLLLRLNTDLSLGGDNDSGDFPTRVVAGADYQLHRDVALFAEQEWTFGDDQDATGTRLGFRASPWKGAQAQTSLEQQNAGAGPRTFANLGLQQTWQLTDRWTLEGAIDHARTLRDPGETPLNENVPLTSGTLNDDFTALSFGGAYRAEQWGWRGQVETRAGELQDKWGLLTSLHQELHEGLAYALSAEMLRSDEDPEGGGVSTKRTDAAVRLGLAYRPERSRWTILNRLDLTAEEESGSEFSFDNRKITNNLAMHYQWSRGLQTSLYYGAKLVRDTIDSESYDGYIDIWGASLRRDLGTRWDIGLSARLRNSYEAGTSDLSYGIEIGHRVMQNLWISAGYNFAGFRDDDFSAAEYTSQGPYLKFRYKFDQQTLRELLDWRDERL